MPKKQTKEDFLVKALQMHGEKYDYSKVEYIDSKTKVTIICPEHGEFRLAPTVHTSIRSSRGETKPRGCPTCGDIIRREKVSEASRNRTKSKDEFVRDAYKVHGKRYDYTKSNYEGSHTKIIITCRENGQGCPECGLEIVRETGRKKRGIPCIRNGKVWTQESFILECTKVHDGKYDYSRTIFTTTNNTIVAECPIHGEFEQMAYDHVRGRGCERCGRSEIGLARRMSFDQWKIIADQTHNHAYTYDKSSYTTSKGKVRIKCSKHGWFEQSAGMHAYAGHGCEDCGNERISSARTRTLDQLIKQARSVHGDAYDYSQIKSDPISNNVIYDSLGKVPINCKEHGTFSIAANNHIHLQQGCPQCAATKGESRVRQYLELNQFDYIFQWSEHDCRDKGKLRFDFYVPDIHTVIEFDGQQHFMPVNFTGAMTEEEMNAKFDDVLRRDGIKEQWCKDNGIRLIRIPYTEDVEETLMAELKKSE